MRLKSTFTGMSDGAGSGHRQRSMQQGHQLKSPAGAGFHLSALTPGAVRPSSPLRRPLGLGLRLVG